MSGRADALASNTALMTDAQSYIENDGLIWCGTSGGSANVQTATPSPVMTAYTTGQKYCFIAGFAPTASATLNLNSLGAKTLKMNDGSTNLSGSEFLAGDLVICAYDGTNMRLEGPRGAILTGWTPTYTASGTGSPTYTTVTTNYGKYYRMGKLVFCQIYATGTTGGTTVNGLRFSLPFACASSTFGGGGAWVYDGGASNVAGFLSQVSTTVMQVSKYDGSNFALAANKQMSANFWFEAA